MDTWSVSQLALQLRLSFPESDSPKRALREALARRARESERGNWDVLDAIDFVCRTVTDLWIPAGRTGTEPIPGTEPLVELDWILATGRSAYRYRNGCLERRVDDTAIAAYERTAATANDEASMHLRRAWAATYGRDPGASRAYGTGRGNCRLPLLLPEDLRPTLGKAIVHLCDRAAEWHFVLPGEREAEGIAPLWVMLQLLWTAQRSRHAGGPNIRDQLRAEAEPALPSVATLVQWFNGRMHTAARRSIPVRRTVTGNRGICAGYAAPI
jgi:hypothetical protein